MDKSVGWLTDGGRWSGVGSALNWIDDRVAVVGNDQVVTTGAAALRSEPGIVTVIGPRDARDGAAVLEAVVPIAVPPGSRGRVAVAGAGDPALGLAARLARELTATIVAPRGDLVLTPGGALFAVDGWLSYDAAGEATPAGRRTPLPDWEAEIDKACDASREGLVALPVPAGVWIFTPAAGASSPDLGDPAYGVPLDAARPVLLIGRPGHPELPEEAVLAFIDELPPALRRRLVLAPYGPATRISAVAGHLARDLDAPVDVSTGLPALLPGDDMISLASTPDLGWWETLTTCLSFSPDGSVESSGQVRGLGAYRLVDDRVFRINERWVAEVTQSGLWVRSPEKLDGADEVRAYPWDPSSLRIFVGVPGEPSGHEVLPLLGALVSRLPVEARRQVSVAPEAFSMVAAAGGAEPSGTAKGPLDSVQRAVVLRVSPQDGPKEKAGPVVPPQARRTAFMPAAREEQPTASVTRKAAALPAAGPASAPSPVKPASAAPAAAGLGAAVAGAGLGAALSGAGLGAAVAGAGQGAAVAGAGQGAAVSGAGPVAGTPGVKPVAAVSSAQPVAAVPPAQPAPAVSAARSAPAMSVTGLPAGPSKAEANRGGPGPFATIPVGGAPGGPLSPAINPFARDVENLPPYFTSEFPSVGSQMPGLDRAASQPGRSFRRSAPLVVAATVVLVVGATGYALNLVLPRTQGNPVAIATTSPGVLPTDAVIPAPAVSGAPGPLPGSLPPGALPQPTIPAGAMPGASAPALPVPTGQPVQPGAQPPGTTAPTRPAAGANPGTTTPTRPAATTVPTTPVKTTTAAAPVMAGAVNTTGRNLALDAAPSASSSEWTDVTGVGAFDGNRATRWSSTFKSDPQWVAADLGSLWQVSEVTLVWETAYATAYRIEVSTDGSKWTSVWSTVRGAGGTVKASFARTPARYVRMYGTARAAEGYGYSLWEFEIR